MYFDIIDKENSQLITPQQFQQASKIMPNNDNKPAMYTPFYESAPSNYENQTDLIDRLASSKSFENFWSPQTEVNKISRPAGNHNER